MNKKLNIILITIDSLRAGHLGFMGHEKKVSPNIDKLAKESAVFTNAFSVGPNSSYSFPSILTSTYPLDYQGPSGIKKPRVLISEVLKEAGYTTAAFHPSPYLTSFFGYDRGWDFFKDLGTSNFVFAAPQKVPSFLLKLFKEVIFSTFPAVYYWIRYQGVKYFKLGALEDSSVSTKLRVNAEFLNRKIRDFVCSVKNEESPFFVWTHYMDVHNPYLPRECYFQKKPYTRLDFLREQRFPQHLAHFPKKRALRKYMQKHLKKGVELYDYGVEYSDYQIGELMNFLKKENLYENSIIIITGDHGDEFLEHGGGGHGNKLYNELLHVPLLIKIPGVTPQIIKRKVSLIDIPSTICDLLEVKSPSSFKGKNLFNSSPDPVVFHQVGFNQKEKCKGLAGINIENTDQCQIACQDKEWKYIFGYGAKKEELYKLSEDPREQNNLKGKETQVLHQMREKIKQFEKDNPPLSLIDNKGQ